MSLRYVNRHLGACLKLKEIGYITVILFDCKGLSIRFALILPISSTIGILMRRVIALYYNSRFSICDMSID